MKEMDILRLIQLALSEAGCTVWRNNVAKAWVGDRYVRLANGDMVIKNPRPLNAGLCVGSSDLIGIYPKKVTQDMVGSTVGIFIGHEIKTTKGRPTDDQSRFIEHVNSRGGIAGIARSPADAIALLAKYSRG